MNSTGVLTLTECAKKGYMQEGPRVEKCPIVIQFWATYVIVMGVSNHSGPVHHQYIKNHI